MAKDRLRYRSAKKFANGSTEVEGSIGITSTYSSASEVQEVDCGAAISTRRHVALLKWSFDDFICEEVVPPEAFQLSTSSGSSDVTSGEGVPLPSLSCLLCVVSEGVADPVIERLLQQRLPRKTSFHFLNPLEYISSTSRHVWVRCDLADLPAAFHAPQHLHTSDGDVFVDAARRINVPAKSPCFPLHFLPQIRYTVTVRNVEGSLGEVLPHLRSVAQRGFLNYSHMARHGVGLFRVYQDAKRLLRRDHAAVVQSYVKRLSEDTPGVRREMPLLLDVLASPRSTFTDWRGVKQGMELAVKEDCQTYRRARQIGIYQPHHDALLDFVMRAADIAPRYHDSAQLLREAVSSLVLQEILQSITAVHGNALISLRWKQYGDRVAVGDLVNVAAKSPNSQATLRDPLDVFVGAADHLNASLTSPAHQNWMRLSERHHRPKVRASASPLRVVKTVEEAAQYSLDQVVLPSYGRDVNLLPNMPTNACGALFHSLAKELNVEGLCEMQLAPAAAYRSLIQRSSSNFSFYLVDEKRGWDWEEDAGSTVLKQSLYHDLEGVLRCRSPLMRRTGKNMIARAGLRDEAARSFFLKPARRPGMMCLMQFTLPPGSHATAVIREVFQITTLSPSALFQLLVRGVNGK